jgi:putative membrane protein insertion efficiency factor
MIDKAAIFLVRQYQKFISPLKGPTCRFIPTCSQYCIDSIEKFGLAKGIFYAALRILRCSPLFKDGYDPVKEK